MINPLPPHRRHGGRIRPGLSPRPGSRIHQAVEQMHLYARQEATGGKRPPKHAQPGSQWPVLPFPSARELWAQVSDTWRTAPWPFKALIAGQILFALVVLAVAVVGLVALCGVVL